MNDRPDVQKAKAAHEHDWRWWGDDPYLKCECGEIRDAHTGKRVP